MAPKARPIDLQQVQTMLDQGHTQRQIAQHLQIPESTLRHRLKHSGVPKVHQGPPSGETAKGVPIVHQGIPLKEMAPSIPQVHLGIPMESISDGHLDTSAQNLGGPEVSLDPPGCDAPTSEPGLPVPEPSEVYEGPPRSTFGTPEEPKRPPALGPHKGDLGIPETRSSPQLADELWAAWPEIQDLLAWWRARHQGEQAPREKLERITYHVAPRWIEAVKREADRSGESYAAVVNRAFALYFSQRETLR